MNDKTENSGNKRPESDRQENQEAFSRERSTFRSLLLTNPNYFGNLEQSPLEPVLKLFNNTFYESLGCVGYQPQAEYLEAVVYIHEPSGYGTDICGPGTPEYVRFYLSFDGGATWQDQGLTSFQAYNIPEGTDGRRRLEYAVSLRVNPPRRFCVFDSLIQVRAILSWNNPPPANQPNWVPVWGDRQDATIQVDPFRFIFPKDIFEIEEIKLPDFLVESLDVDQPIPLKTKALSVQELSTLYAKQDVPVHRFAYKELASYVQSQTTLSAEAFVDFLPDIQINPDIIDILFPKDGNTSYEELKCIGLDPNTPDTLVGVIQVKQSSGYSGGPCTKGSAEYVTFWADFDNNGTFDTCLGTAEVRVYDLNGIPAGGVYYAVRLPVDLNEYRQSCKRGPRVVPIRAILSWNTPMDCSNPNGVPVWGNREQTLINIAPSASVPAGKIAILGGIPVVHIDNSTGLTTASAVFATNNLAPDAFGRPCPFGGRVSVQGAPLIGHSYKVEVIPEGSVVPVPVVHDLVVTRSDGTTFTHTADPTTGRFTYLPFHQNINSLLAQWDTTGDLKWRVRLSTFDAANNLIGTDTHWVQLDNTAPEASITITTGPGDCGKFPSGFTLTGSFVATDLYLSGYSLSVEPAVNDPGEAVPTPSGGLVNTAPAPGDTWDLDTTGMDACGYVIRVVASDRAIVNSQSSGHVRSDSVGFCLE